MLAQIQERLSSGRALRVPLPAENDSPAREPRVSVLLVEGDVEEAVRLRGLLSSTRSRQHDVTWIRGELAALNWLAENVCDVILLKLTTWDRQARTILQILDARTPAIPVVVLTSETEPQVVDRCLQNGAQECLLTGSPDYPHGVDRAIGYAIDRLAWRRQLEESRQALQQSETCYRTLVRSLPDGAVLLLDPELRIVLADGLSLVELGVNPSELEGQTLQSIDPAEIRGLIEPGAQAALDGHHEKQDASFGGQIYRSHATPVRNEMGEIVAGMVMIQNVTPQVRQEAALRESKQRYQQLIENAPLGIAVFEADGTMTMANPTMCRLVQGTEPSQSLDFYERFLTETGLAEQIKRSILDRKRTMMEVSYSRDDDVPLQLRVHLTPMMGDNDQVRSVQALFEDVTEHRQVEREDNHRQKLEAVGALAAGIAHEINTPIQFIGDNAHFLRDAFGDLLQILATEPPVDGPDEAQGTAITDTSALSPGHSPIDLDFFRTEIPLAVDQIQDGLSRVADIVNAMRTFAHPVTGVKSPADLNDMLQHTLTVARNEYKYVADVETDLDPSLPLVSCDPGEINQVFLNLIVNAAHAIKDRIETDPSMERGQITVRSSRQANGVTITVEDTGTGIPPEVERRIFDPFFTTKPMGQGTGQGLAIAHSVITKRHQGRLSFETEMGEGTSFYVFLPLHVPDEEAEAGA